MTVYPRAGKTQARLGALFGSQQSNHDDQQQGGQLCRSNAVVHHQPRFVNACGEGLNAEVARHAKVGQGLHQGQSCARGNGRPSQRQRHTKDAPRQRRA